MYGIYVCNYRISGVPSPKTRKQSKMFKQNVSLHVFDPTLQSYASLLFLFFSPIQLSLGSQKQMDINLKRKDMEDDKSKQNGKRKKSLLIEMCKSNPLCLVGHRSPTISMYYSQYM